MRWPRCRGCACRDGHRVSLSKGKTRTIFFAKSVSSCVSTPCWKAVCAKPSTNFELPTSSIRYYEQALKLDPNYALAYCGIADTYAYMGGVVMPSKEAVAKEKEFAERAIQLDPELPEARLSLACALGGAFDWRNAQIEFDRAIELNPNLAWAYEIYAWFLGGLGRSDEAIAKDKKAIELDPL